ncbi:hypothetical protein MTO96_029085 [Rhipicephalus appendiculatus]
MRLYETPLQRRRLGPSDRLDNVLGINLGYPLTSAPDSRRDERLHTKASSVGHSLDDSRSSSHRTLIEKSSRPSTTPRLPLLGEQQQHPVDSGATLWGDTRLPERPHLSPQRYN